VAPLIASLNSCRAASVVNTTTAMPASASIDANTINITDRLSAHLTVAEFTHPDTAARLGVDNSLPGELVEAAQATGTLLERVRSALGTPMLVSSGYGCLALNTTIGSGPGSDHSKAVDFSSPDFGMPLAVCQALEPRLEELGIGQII